MQKATIERVVRTLPDEVDVDELVEKLYMLQKIEIAEKQLAAGKGIPHEEAKMQMKPWLE